MKFKGASLYSLPYLIWTAAFVILPTLMVIVFAFTVDGRFSIDNISKVGIYTPVFVRSIWLSLIATLICLIVGYPIAYIMSRAKKSRQRTLVMLIMLPMWTNFLLRTFAWMTLLEKNGIINSILGMFGMEPLRMINTSGAVILGIVYNYLPFMILPLYSVMTKIDKSVIEAAQDLGADNLSTFIRVLLPLTIPGITTGITSVFIPAVSTFVISRMLGGGMNIMIGELIDTKFLGQSPDPNMGSAISLVLMVFVLVMMSITNQFDDSDERQELAL